MHSFPVAASFISLALICASALAAGTAPSGALPAFPAEAFRPSLQDGHYLPSVRGTWHLRGGGYYAEVQADHAQFYSYADDGRLCWPDWLVGAAGPGESLLGYYAQSAARDHTAFADAPGNLQFRADAVAARPAACDEAIDRSSPLYTFDAAAASLRDYYSFSAERHIDWAERSARLRPLAAAARNDEELAPVFVELLAGLQDLHTSIGIGEFSIGLDFGSSTLRTHRLLREAFAAQSEITDFSEWLGAWSAKQNDAIYALLAPAGRGREYGDAIVWGTLEGDVGYLAVNRVDELGAGEGSDERALVNRALDRALDDLKTTRALVLDLSTNSGGSTDTIADVAARFADQRRLAYTRQMPHDAAAAPQPFYVEPGGNVRYAKPVHVLTSDLTVSAAEYLVLYLRALPQTRHVGQTTQGALAGSFVHGLPNDWRIRLSNHITRDPQGNSHEVVGILPDLLFDVFPEQGFGQGRVEAIRKAAASITAAPTATAVPATGRIAAALMAASLLGLGVRRRRSPR